jgi:hypothetical protein
MTATTTAPLRSLRTAGSALLLGAAAVATSAFFGCSSSSASNGYAAPDASGGGADAKASTGTPDAAAEASGGDDGDGSSAISLPFFVSSEFIPSGFMNDPTGISVSTGANGSASCPTRAPGAGGDCYVISWTSTGPTWAGVYWQYPSNNWGTEPGLAIAPGAKQVSFYAQGAAGGEVLTFKTGGINDPVNMATGTYGDTFAVSSPVVTLTTSWTQYTISLEGASYSQGVLGAFVWVATASDAGNDAIKFYLDDLTWE